MTNKKTDDGKTESTALATANVIVPAAFGQGLSLDDLQQDAGSGLQNVAAADLSTPMLLVLQANSPQVKRSEGEYIQGATDGMIFNNLTKAIFNGDEGVVVIPCSFEKKYIEWLPNRGGFVAAHEAGTNLKDQVKMVKSPEGKEVPTLPNGNSLIETNQHYALIVGKDGSFEAVIIPMTSSALKASRIWNSLQKKVVLQNSKGQHFTPASYYSTYKLTTKAKTKDKYSWYTWSVEPAGPTPSAELYAAAKAFEKAVAGGKIKPKLDTEMQASSDHTSNDPEDDNIPF